MSVAYPCFGMFLCYDLMMKGKKLGFSQGKRQIATRFSEIPTVEHTCTAK